MRNTNPFIFILSDHPEEFRELINLLNTEGVYSTEILSLDIRSLEVISNKTPVLIIGPLQNKKLSWKTILASARKAEPAAPVIFTGGMSDIDEAIMAVREGADDFIVFPADSSAIHLRIKKTLGNRNLQEQVRDLQREIRFRRNSDYIVGDSFKVQEVLGKIIKISDSEIPVLISGESGTGKELVARAVHYNSSRSGGPFIAINCSTLPENLIENELFGHEKGSFTGADSAKRGLFDEAHKGTLFLDEIGDLALSVQTKLLTVLERGEFRRVGGLKTIKSNVRIITATNKILEKEVEEGRFREDLYYRINVFPIKVPPLRERREDIPQLANYFVRKHQEGPSKKNIEFSASAIQKLMFYAWPGNVRELENKVRQALINAKGPNIFREDITLDLQDTGTPLKTFKEAKKEFEINFIVNILRISNGNVSEAARLSGKDRKDFYDVMKRHKIKSEDFRTH